MRPETPSDPPRQLLTTARGVLAYTDEGDPESPHTFLMVPGLPGSVRDFRWLATTLTPHARVVRVELPGFGQSTREGFRGMKIAERAGYVVELIHALELAPVTLVGHSSGGTVIAQIARHRPELVHRCAFLATPGMRAHYPIRLYRTLATLFRWPLGRAVMHPVQRALYSALGFPSSLTDGERMYTSLDAAATEFEVHADNVGGLQTSSLVAWARDDRLIASELFEGFEARCTAPGPRLRFDEGGHNIQKTQAVELGEALMALVKE